ncbi:MAG: hypothetical protein JW731_07130 [Bacteroidales bacterium]|nr:hypothetical protein [Bacteroidales bacterium]
MKIILNVVIWGGMSLAIVLMIMGYIDFYHGGNYFGLSHSSTFFTIVNTVLLWVVIAKFFYSDWTKKKA